MSSKFFKEQQLTVGSIDPREFQHVVNMCESYANFTSIEYKLVPSLMRTAYELGRRVGQVEGRNQTRRALRECIEPEILRGEKIQD